MAIYGISDLHLALAKPFVPGEEPQIYKPMDVFGPHWQGHPVPMYENWCENISPEDSVLVPGDLSWAQIEALGDLTVYQDVPEGGDAETIERIGDSEIVIINKTHITYCES